ncbi:MAG: phosphate regulon sensor histidine kinase PhoR [Gammaproteobacteria bacterium]|nr:phosphate regulon sensor histidine kinase PhoR [Gammaproteobacteria bacterium]
MLSPVWSFALARLVLALAVAVALGLLFGHVALWLVVVLGGALGWQFASLYRLQHWLRFRSQEDPPDLGGVWGDVVALVGRLYRSKKFHRRRTLVLLREFRRFAAVLPDGVVLLTVRHEIRWFNPAAARLLELRRKLDFGAPITNLVRDPALARYLECAGAGPGIVVRVQREGAERCLALALVEAGAWRLLLVRDVSRETALLEMRKDFIANASHELRSPLTVIAGYVEALQDEPDLDDEWRAPLADMRRQAERMRRIVEDLLELSRLEAGGEEASFDPVDMPALLEQLVRDAGSRRPDGPRLQTEISAGCGLLGNAPELQSIAANLLANALQYTPAGGTVTVRWSGDAGGACLAVADTGIGIAAQHLPRLTERFYRVDKGRSRDSGGSGLGLAIVRHAVQRHGGRLEIVSVEGQGSTFTVHFPARRLQQFCNNP